MLAMASHTGEIAKRVRARSSKLNSQTTIQLTLNHSTDDATRARVLASERNPHERNVMQHPLITTAMATEHQHHLRAEGAAAGRREGSSGWLRSALRRRAAKRPTPCGTPCLEPRTAS